MQRWLWMLLAAAALASCGPSQSRACKEMLARMDGCEDLDPTTRRLMEQMGYEEDGACWEDAEFAEACTQTCKDTLDRWDAAGICP